MKNDFKDDPQDDLRKNNQDDHYSESSSGLDENLISEDNREDNNEENEEEVEGNSENKTIKGDDLVSKLKEENKNLEDKYKRALADYQNLLKNSAEEKLDLLKYSLEGFLLDILPIYNNLNMSINNLTDEQASNPWVEGVKYIIKQFDDFFSKNDVLQIKTIGEKFDYNTMDAAEGEGEYVVKELLPGYKLKGKTIIAARVAVGDKIKNKFGRKK